MPARDVLWEPGMTLPWERMNGLSCSYRLKSEQVPKNYPIPRLVQPDASTDQIAEAVWKYMGVLPKDAYPSELVGVGSILSRQNVHHIHYDQNSLYQLGEAFPVYAFICQIGHLPEDEEYDASPQTDPDGWDWGPDGWVATTRARRVYRWRVNIGWREPRLFVKVEKLMQFQKMAKRWNKEKNADDIAWFIFNKGGQNQLYAWLPDQKIWWSGADVGDWIETHALDIEKAIEMVVWALISVVTLGAGAGAAAGVAAMKLVVNTLKDAAMAAATGRPFDFSSFVANLASAAVQFASIPWVSDFLNKAADWLKKAGEQAARALLGNGIFSTFMSSGGGFLSDLASQGVKIYNEVKGYFAFGKEAYSQVKSFVDNLGHAISVGLNTAPSALPDFVNQALDKMRSELQSRGQDDLAKLPKLALQLLQPLRDDLDRKLKDVEGELKGVRDALPGHLQPWFDFGVRGMHPDSAPFYAKSAVNLGSQAASIHAAVKAEINSAAKALDVQILLLQKFELYHLRERYAVLEAVTKLAGRYP
jgi:hypothetical protein